VADTILLIEDEPLVRMVLAHHLEECGYDVLEAETADQALTLLEWHPEIDVVFTDVRMPGSMDGISLAKWVIEHRPGIAVMVASGHTAQETLAKELCSAKAFSKPYNLNEVTTHIREAIHALRRN
jgi:DNA-binding NtrC family response regulator